MELNELLERYPWSEEWKRHHPKRLEHWKPELWKRIRPLESLWSFRVDLSVDDLWSQISDTSKTNRALGLPEMSFVEEDGVLFGRSNNAGWIMEWEDIPWEWIYGKELSNARIYSRGPACFVRARYITEEANTPSSSMLHIYFGWIPRNLAGRLFLKLGMLAMKSRYAALLSNLKKTEQGPTPSLPSPTVEFRFDDTVRSRIEIIKEHLAGTVPSTLLNDLFDYFEKSPEDELDRIRPYTVAERLLSTPEAIVSAMLHLTREGVLTLSWDVICPHCLGVRQSLPALGDIPEQARCDICMIDFDATSYHALEITFHLHPSIRTVQKRFYCSAEPARKPHILLQKTVAPLEQETLELNLSPSQYRIRCIGRPEIITLQAEGADSTPFNPIEAEARVDIASMDKQINNGLTVRVPGTISVVNSSKQRQVFVIDRIEERADILRPADLFLYQDFRDLFSEEALRPGLQLNIGTQYLLMTDLVDSTRLYDTQGDAAAFRSVKQHFEIGFAEVKKNKGAVVKTIGDALFAVLPSATALVTTALAIQKAFQNQPLKLRVALQSGPVLAVNLNTGIDYFGNTVNLLAKIEGALESGEIGMPASMYESPEIRRILDDRTTAPIFREPRFSWKQEGLRIAAVRPLLAMTN